MRPVGQAPLLVEAFDRAVGVAQWSTKRWNTSGFAISSLPLVVDLVPDHRRWSAYRATIFRITRSAWNRTPGGRGRSPAGRPSPSPRRRPAADVDLRHDPREPHRHRVRRRAEDHPDAVLVRGVEHGCEPLQVEPAVLRSQVLQTDSPTRTTEKPASSMRRMSSSSRGWAGTRGSTRRPKRTRSCCMVRGAPFEGVGGRGRRGHPLTAPAQAVEQLLPEAGTRGSSARSPGRHRPARGRTSGSRTRRSR